MRSRAPMRSFALRGFRASEPVRRRPGVVALLQASPLQRRMSWASALYTVERGPRPALGRGCSADCIAARAASCWVAAGVSGAACEVDRFRGSEERRVVVQRAKASCSFRDGCSLRELEGRSGPTSGASPASPSHARASSSRTRGRLARESSTICPHRGSKGSSVTRTSRVSRSSRPRAGARSRARSATGAAPSASA